MSLTRTVLKATWPFLWTVIKRFNRDDGSVLCGYIAYSMLLASVPFLIFATALAGFLVGAHQSQQVATGLLTGLPGNVTETIRPVLVDVLGQRRGGVLTLSALGAIWAASNGVEAIRVGLDRAYDVGDVRHVALGRLISVGVVLAGFVVFTLLSVLIVFAPLAFALVQHLFHVRVPLSLDFLRYGLGGLVLTISLWFMHRVLPSRPMGGLRLWPGILASVMIWVIVATGMSIYLAYAPSYTVTYGTLAGVVVTLLFFYLTGLALLFGAEINATINFGPPAAARGRDAADGSWR